MMRGISEYKVALEQAGFVVAASRHLGRTLGTWWIRIAGRPSFRVVWDGKDRGLILQRRAADAFSDFWQDLWIARDSLEQRPERLVAELLLQGGDDGPRAA